MPLQGAVKIGLSLGKAAKLGQHNAHEIESADMHRLGAQERIEEALSIPELAGVQRGEPALEVVVAAPIHC